MIYAGKFTVGFGVCYGLSVFFWDWGWELVGKTYFIFYFGTDVVDVCFTGFGAGSFYFSFSFIKAAMAETFSFNWSLNALI